MTDEDRTAEGPDDRFAVSVIVTKEQAAELLARNDLDFGCRPHLRPNPDGTALLTIFASVAVIAELRARGYRLDVGENVSAAGRKHQDEVGRGDRFEGGRISPRGLGRKLGGRGPTGSGSGSAS